jgi:hypothetical protein
MKKHLLLIFILSILSICSYAQDATFSTAGAYNITIPPGVTSIRVDAYGGGGGGGGSNSSNRLVAAAAAVVLMLPNQVAQ